MDNLQHNDMQPKTQKYSPHQFIHPENQLNDIQPQQQPEQHPQIELQNQINQKQNEKPPIKNSAQEEGEQGEVQPQSNSQEDHQSLAQKNSQQIPNLQLSIDKDRYINKLETYLNKVNYDLETKSKEFIDLFDDNKKTKQSLKKLRFEFLSSKQQISGLNKQQSDLQQQKQKLQKLNQELSQQINVYKDAGDISIYKNKIIELQKLVEVQKKQLRMKQAMIDENEEQKQSLRTQKSKLQILTLIEKYQKQNQQLGEKHYNVCLINTQLKNQKQHLEEEIRKLKTRVAETQEILTLDKQKIIALDEQIKKNQEEYQKKLRNLQQNLSYSTGSQENLQMAKGKASIFQTKKVINPCEQYGIKIMDPIEERNLIMREFIEMEIKYQTVVEELSNLRERHYNTLRQIKNISVSHVLRKDYSELYKKYSKLRKCLENALINQQNLRKELSAYTNFNKQFSNSQQNKSMNEEATNAFSRYKSFVLQQPENALNKVQKIIQNSSVSQKHLFTLKQQLQTKQRLIKTEKLLKQQEDKLHILLKEVQKSKTLIHLYDNQLTYKNNQIEVLRKNNRQSIQRIIELEKNSISKDLQNQLNSKIQQTKILNQILEVKNVHALKENSILRNQKQILTQLYNDLKKMYEEILNRQPEEKPEPSNSQQKDQNMMEIEHKPCKNCLERQQKQKEIKFLQVESQTQGLTEFYFKQIKQLLTILRKFPKKVDIITASLEEEKSTIHQVKKKYDQAVEAYKNNLKQLEEEKKTNDQWRNKQKDQIREQFQQIRQLLMNERLVTALKKAKSLIEFYEQNAAEAECDQNPQEGEQEQGLDKNQGNNEEAIEQEKQNQ